jgi:hypothetical protein
MKLARAAILAGLLCSAAGLFAPAAGAAATPEIKHLFTIVLENKDAGQTFGSSPPSWYLGKTMPAEGALVPNYFGIGHHSLVNYIAMISGQPPNLKTQHNCGTYTEMLPGELDSDGVAVGQGCVFPPAVTTVAGQLEAAGRGWRAYMQDMANSVGAGLPGTCRHPAIIDSATCDRNVVDLRLLPEDLATAERTPAYSFIVPDLCADGHDWQCADGTSPGGYDGINAFLQEWVPRIKASAAYQDRGMILVTFDEGETAEACCGETSGPNTENNGAGQPGDGGGRVGAVMLSPCIAPGTVSLTAYNHYSYLRWVEDNFGLPHLANAAPAAVGSFGTDILNRPDCSQGASLAVRPRKVPAGRKTEFRFRLFADLPLCREEATIHFAGRTLVTDANGEATVRLRLRGRGRRVAAAVPEICDPATATVWVKRRHPSRARAGIGGAAPVG